MSDDGGITVPEALGMAPDTMAIAQEVMAKRRRAAELVAEATRLSVDADALERAARKLHGIEGGQHE